MAEKDHTLTEQERILQIDRSTSYFGSLKPLGKVCGNNLFTFHRPNLEELMNTLRSFPKPIYWLTSANFLLSKSTSEISDNISVFKLTQEKTNNVLGNLSIADLAEFLTSHSNQKAMIVISCNEQDEELFGFKIDEIIAKLK